MKDGAIEYGPEFKPENIKRVSDNAIISLHSEGLTQTEIARRLGVSQGAISQRNKKLGLTPNVYNTFKHDEEKPAPAPSSAPEPKKTTRESVLEAAKVCVCGNREQDYGSPEQNFQTIANMWIDYLIAKDDPLDLRPKDVAAMLAMLKIARIASGHSKADNWVDLAGYAACGGELEAMDGIR